MLNKNLFWTTTNSDTTSAIIYSDNFDSYANGAVLGDQANWDAENNTMGIIKPAAEGRVYSTNAGETAAYYVGTFSADQWSQATYTGSGAGRSIGVAVRCSGTGARDYYGWYTDTAASYLFKVDNGTYATLAEGTLWTVNDVVKLEIVGSELRCYRNGSLDTSVSTDGKLVDTTFTTGNPGLCGYNTGTTVTIDNWSGGNV